MVLKLDMEKAFDRMEWSFLFRISKYLGFHFQWNRMIEQYISTVSFSILLDGSPFGNFFPQRGLRHGDPLSPFLFILRSEVLSRLLIRDELAGNIHGIKISRHSPSVSHIFYANDLMVFSLANSFEASRILNCLTKFSSWSGQKVNIDN